VALRSHEHKSGSRARSELDLPDRGDSQLEVQAAHSKEQGPANWTLLLSIQPAVTVTFA